MKLLTCKILRGAKDDKGAAEAALECLAAGRNRFDNRLPYAWFRDIIPSSKSPPSVELFSEVQQVALAPTKVPSRHGPGRLTSRLCNAI